MDKLAGTDFLRHLTGNVYLSQHQAMTALRHLQREEGAAPTQAAPVLSQPTVP
jgi:hypothetical protein